MGDYWDLQELLRKNLWMVLYRGEVLQQYLTKPPPPHWGIHLLVGAIFLAV